MERVVSGDGRVTIGGRQIGPGMPTFLIAELGINHGGRLDTAVELVCAAAEAGVDAVKLQTYRTEKRVPADSPIFDVLKQCELGPDEHHALNEAAKANGVELISTPFDYESVALLSELGVPAYKIASFDIVNLALIERVAAEGKPVVVSRGMASINESDRAIEVIREAGAPAVILHCVSAYPLEPTDANLAVMDTLRTRYAVPVGYSDHTLGINVAALAVARGADAIEKHFTIDRNADGPDHLLSADPSQLAELVRRVREVEAVLGSSAPRRLEAETGTVPYRRPSEPA